MRINKVLFSCNDNPLYYDFWESISEQYATEFGIEPILLYYGVMHEARAARLALNKWRRKV